MHRLMKNWSCLIGIEKGEGMEETFLAFVLDDYSKPPFVSGSKTYYGTLDAFEGLLTECRNEQLIEPYE